MTAPDAHARVGGWLSGVLHAMPAALWAAIYVGIAAATLPAVLPVMVGVMADQLGFGLAHAGYVASFNMAGIAVGSVFGAALTRRWSWARVVVVGALVMIGANGLTMIGTSFAYVAATRFASGLGEGLIAGICYAAMGRSGQAARALAFYAAGQGLVGAVGMGFMATVIAHFGWQMLFVLVSAVALPALWLAPRISTLHDGRVPAAPAAPAVSAASVVPTGSVTSTAAPRNYTWLGWGAVAALLAQFIGMSSIWAFLERLGHAKGLDPVHLSLALSASAIASMIGSLLVGVLAHRVRGLYGIAAAFALLAASLAAAFLWDDWQVYLVAGVFFMLSWAVYFPFQFGLLANFDRSGALAAIMPAVTGIGFTVGPAVGGVLMARGGIGAILGWGALCMLISTLACVALHRISRSNTHDMVG